MTKTKVKTLFRKPVYFDDFSNMFSCTIGGVTFEERNMNVLEAKMEEAGITEVDEVVINAHSYGGMEKARVIRIADNKRAVVEMMGNTTTSDGSRDFNELFPLNEHNQKVFEEHVKMREAGWVTIHKADRMVEDLQPFPKDHFKKLGKKL